MFKNCNMNIYKLDPLLLESLPSHPETPLGMLRNWWPIEMSSQRILHLVSKCLPRIFITKGKTVTSQWRNSTIPPWPCDQGQYSLRRHVNIMHWDKFLPAMLNSIMREHWTSPNWVNRCTIAEQCAHKCAGHGKRRRLGNRHRLEEANKDTR